MGSTPTLNKALNIGSAGLSTAGLIGSIAGKGALSGVLGGTMAGLMTNPFTLPIAAALPFLASVLGPGKDGPRQVGATKLVEEYDRFLTQRRDEFLANKDQMTPEQRLQFAADQERHINNMFKELEANRNVLGDKVTDKSINERKPGGVHDFHQYYVAPITGGATAQQFASQNGLEMPSAAPGSQFQGAFGGGPSASQIFGGGGQNPINFGGGGTAQNPLAAFMPQLGGGGSAAPNSPTGLQFGARDVSSPAGARDPESMSSGGGRMALNLGSILGSIGGFFQNNPAALNALITGGMALPHALMTRNANNNANQVLESGIGDLFGRGDIFANMSADQQAQAMQAISQMFGQGGQTPEMGNIQSEMAQTAQGIPGLFQQNLANPGAIQNLLQTILDPRTQGSLDAASQAAMSGGRTPETNFLMDRASSFLDGSTGQQMQMQGVADQFLQDGGMTPFLRNLMGASENALATQGMTPEMQQALGPMLQMMMSGGKTPENMAMFGRGMDLFNREALLPMSTAVGLARDEAGRAVSQQANAARREAQMRGGGPGAVVGAGSANDARADFANDAAMAEAANAQAAMRDQQGLQLQQMGIGAQGAGAGLAQMMQALGIGTSGASNILGTAAQRESAMGGLGATGQTIANQRGVAGADMLQQILNTALRGGDLMGAVGQLQNQRFGTGLQGAQGLGGLQQDGMNQILRALLEGEGLGTQRGTGIANALTGNQEVRSRNEVSTAGNLTNLIQLLGQLSGQNVSGASSAYSSGSGLFNPLSAGTRISPMAQFFAQAGSGIGTAVQEWGNTRANQPVQAPQTPGTWHQPITTQPINNPFGQPIFG